MRQRKTIATGFTIITAILIIAIVAMWLTAPTVASEGAENPETDMSAAITPSEINYMAQMVECAVSGDAVRGREAAELRNEKIHTRGLDCPYIDWEDLFLLSKIMTLEAGNCPHDECSMGVGEVVLNRVASPEWDMPSTIEEVLKAPGQYYYPTMAATFESALPDERCVLLALRLLEGERNLQPSVIFHDNNPNHGSGVYQSYKHEGHSTLYFCVSSYPELY